MEVISRVRDDEQFLHHQPAAFGREFIKANDHRDRDELIPLFHCLHTKFARLPVR